ncbi:MAG: C25 family cysteine peptidase, partial [Marinilabiliaceae bacterium]|nr:C25 family cysteine peptidase [Marinilabiliaceae bacterium]
MGGVTYTRLMLPGGSAVNSAGSPELPVLRYKFAVPEHAGIDIVSKVTSRQTLSPCLVYPVPNYEFGTDADGNDVLVEQFTYVANAYAVPRTGNEPVAIVASNGAFRKQKYSEIDLNIFEYCPVSGNLEVLENFQITLEFQNPTGEFSVDLGIFSKTAELTFINYEGSGISAVANDKKFMSPNFQKGSITWKNISTPADVVGLECDYLIITTSQFFSELDTISCQVYRLADHRASYNGYDVVILNSDQIIAANFDYEGNPGDPLDPDKYIKEQRIRKCIKTIYETGTANNTVDGSLGFVLLVGDYENNVGIPGSKDHDYHVPSEPTNKYPSDYYYSCITKDVSGIYDKFGDIIIGRFCVVDSVQLCNIVQKTINHEVEYSPQFWRKTAGFSNTYTDFGYDRYYDFLINIMNSSGWNYTIVEGNWQCAIPTINYLNTGTSFVQYIGMPNVSLLPSSWECGLSTNYFSEELSNNYKVPFISAVSSNTGHFDDMDCVGEFLTSYSSTKGAVGYIGPTRRMTLQISYPSMLYHELILHYFFIKKLSIAGELLLATKYNDLEESYNLHRKYGYILFGDPALNILAEGYEITRDVTAECPAEINTQVSVRNNATLTVPANCSLSFSGNGSLIIEEDGNLVIGENALITSDANGVGNSIIVNGGNITIGDGATFSNLSGGVTIGKNFDVNQTPYYDNMLYSLSNVNFNNTNLNHINTRLNLTNCNFTNSDVSTYASKATIDGCSFDASSFVAYQSDLIEAPPHPRIQFASTTIKNSYFIDSEQAAISIYDSPYFEISTNQITGCSDGIYLSGCGFTQSQLW